MNNKKKIVIIGGGAAGMMAALFAKNDNNEVIILERNKKLGKKIYITGKGRCNITNDSDVENHIKNCLRNNKFMYTSLYSFDAYSTIELFNKLGLKTKTERGNRVFPMSDKASDVVKVLEDELIKKGVEIKLNIKVDDLLVHDQGFSIITKSEKIFADRVLVATGGASYFTTGSDGTFMKIVNKLGHNIKKITPSLVPFITKEDVKELAGLTLNNIELKINSQNIKLFGDLLFTHKGISGPIVLSASALLDEDVKFPIKAELNFKPALTQDVLDKRLIREFEANINKNIYNVMKSLLPQKLIEPIISRCGIDKYDKVNMLSKKDRKELVKVIQNFEISLISKAGFNEAVITKGGVNVKEIDPHTMQSKLIKGLYFAGEIIDIDSMTGGYNLQLAWSSGYLAGISIGEVK